MIIPLVAKAVTIQVCVSAANNPAQLWDYSPTLDGRDLLEDFGRLDQPGSLAVPHLLTSVSDSNSIRLWGWAPLDAQGCTGEFQVAANTEITIESYFWSYDVNRDVSVVSLDCGGGGLDCTSGSITRLAIVPQSDDIVDVELGTARRSYVHFAAATSESRVPHGSNTTFYTRTGIAIDTISNRVAGGKPTSNIGGEGFRSKFTVAHEYGHLKTAVASIPNFGNDDFDYCHGGPMDCTVSWAPESPEWQSAAAIEGFADFHAMLVWNDPDGDPRDGVKSWDVSETSWRCRYRPDPSDQGNPEPPDDCEVGNLDVTVIADSWHYQQNCDPMDCVPGVATAADWAWALWDTRLFTNVPTNTLLDMLSFAHPWPLNGQDSDYWNNFIQNVTGPALNGNDLTVWIAVSEIRGIDD